ncbi:hypothetical protein DIPPA_12236 [Diplonema papillatum]|nr:hypothetical protein DIPPA_12236 [Diplonema papillatum]
MDAFCSNHSVSVRVAGRNASDVRLLTPAAKTTAPLEDDSVARFTVAYNQPARAPMPFGGADGISDAELAADASLAAWGHRFDEPDREDVEGWDSSPGVPNRTAASYRGVWGVASSEDAVGGRYFHVRSLPDTRNPLFMRYLTDGRAPAGAACPPGVAECAAAEDPGLTGCCRLHSPGRVVGGAAFSIQFRALSAPRADGTASSDTGRVEVEYWKAGAFPRLLSTLAVDVPTATMTPGAWTPLAKPHTAPLAAHYASIRVMCWKNDATAASDDACRVHFDEVYLVRLGGEEVWLQYTANQPGQKVGSVVSPVACGPTRVEPEAKTTAAKPALCTPATCNNNGYCGASWTCPKALAAAFPAYCCTRALAFCCGGVARDTADAEFKATCGHAFCSGMGGQVPVPAACATCYDDDARGHWAGPNCERCRDGFYGTTCRERICATNPDNGRECSGHGVCLSNGQCKCFGEEQAEQAGVPALKLAGEFLELTRDVQQRSVGGIAVYDSCTAVLQDHASAEKKWGAPDDGVFALRARLGGANETQRYFCKFLADSKLAMHGLALVGGVWRRHAAVSLPDTVSAASSGTPGGAGYQPLRSLAAANGTGSRIFEYAVDDPLDPVGARWSHQTLQDGGEAGAFGRYPPGTWGFVVFATNPADPEALVEWVMLSVPGLADAVREAVAVQGVPVKLRTAASNTKTVIGTAVCVYSSGGAAAPFVGIFAGCAAGSPAAAWKLWFGEGVGTPAQRVVSNSVRIYASDSAAGMDFPEGQKDWSDAVTSYLPTQYSTRAPSSLLVATTHDTLDPRVIPWHQWTSRPIPLTPPGVVEITFNTESTFRALPSPLVEISVVRLEVFVAYAGAAAVPVRVRVQPDARSPKPWRTIHVVNGTAAYEASWERSGAGGDGPVDVSELVGLMARLEFAGGAGGEVFVSGALLHVGYQRVPPLEAFGLTAMLKLARIDEGLPMTLFRASHGGRDLIEVQLNRAANGDIRPGSVRVSVVDSRGAAAAGASTGLLTLFSNRWVRLHLNVSLQSGAVRVFLGRSKTENGQYALDEQPVEHSAAAAGKLLVRAVPWMSDPVTFGTRTSPFYGFLREVAVWSGGEGAAAKVYFARQDLSQASEMIAFADPSVGSWETATVPPKGTSYDGVSSKEVPTDLGYWSGELCDACREGYHGGLCSSENCASDDECGGGANATAPRGACVRDEANALFFGQCLCAENYDGEACDRCESAPVRAVYVGGDLRCIVDSDICPSAAQLAANPGVYTTAGTLDDAVCALGGKTIPGEYFDFEEEPPVVDCTVDGVRRCLPPSVKHDGCGCPTSRQPVCSGAGDAANATECPCDGVAPYDTAVTYNCRMYANPFVSCPKGDACRDAAGAPAPTCQAGTEGLRQYSKFCLNQLSRACDGAATPTYAHLVDVLRWLPRTAMRFFGECPNLCPSLNTGTVKTTGGHCGPCPVAGQIGDSQIDCEGALFDVHVPQQVMKEDFCGCTSPVMPVCDPTTVDSWNTSVRGTLTCKETCPDWAALYGAAGYETDGDAVFINCGGWPAPEWAQLPCSQDGHDPCECPLPSFRCTGGTEGTCPDSSACPPWDDVAEIDCKGGIAPVVNRIGAHVCGCAWPPDPVCKSGTSAAASAVCPVDYTLAAPSLKDCEGKPLLESVAWRPGSSRWPLTRGCSACKTDVSPNTVCRAGSQCPIVKACPPGTDKATGVTCASVVWESIQCGGAELPPYEQPDRPECWCAPPVQFRCEDSDGCFGNATKCAPYVCGDGRFVAPVPADECRTSCSGDNHCVEDYICVDGGCVPEGTSAPPLGGCAGDPSVCEPYGCNVAAGACFAECWTDKHCFGGAAGPGGASGYRCSFPTQTGLPAVPAYQVLAGGLEVFREMPGNLCGASVFDSGADVAAKAGGRCVWMEYDPNACYDQVGCAPYACGKNNSQIAFSSAICRTSCSNDAHCNFKAHCNKDGACVPGAPSAPASCSAKDYDYCTPFVCGVHIALAPKATALCRTTCESDGQCQLFYTCVSYTCVATPVVAAAFQPVPAVPRACYKPGQEHAGAPYKCLRVPLALNGDPQARFAYALPPAAPAAVEPVPKACKAHAGCVPYRCGPRRGIPDKDIPDGSMCQVTCQVFDDCAEGYSCFKKKCIQQRAIAAQCDTGGQCASGHCVDGVCCNQACDLPCQKCTSMGVCDWVGAGTDLRNDCGRCATCVASSDADVPRECGAIAEGMDPKGDCGNHGVCNGDAQCECHASKEAGHWAGAACDRCAAGYAGALCSSSDTFYTPPAPIQPGMPPIASAQLFSLERRPVQFPVRVLDYTTQAIPANIHNVVGKPDATDTYYKTNAPNRQKAWQPIQYYCNRRFFGASDCPWKLQKNAEWKGKLQYVVLEYEEPIYLSQVYVFENSDPGSVVAIYAQPAPTGADASPGGGAPGNEMQIDGVVSSSPAEQKPSSVPDQRKSYVDANSTDDASASTAPNGTSASINTNPVPFVQVWRRDAPMFYSNPIARVYAPATDQDPFLHPTTPVSLESGGTTTVNVEWKTKVIKLVINASSENLVQIDTVGILGFANAVLNKTGECPGVTTVSADPVGSRTSSGKTRQVMCSGNGACKPKGCECKGNFDGAECANCKFGYTGVDCDKKVLMDVPTINMCSIVMFEDIMDFEGEALELRWFIQDYTFKTTRVFKARHFGTKFFSPLITLGSHSHIRVQAGFFVSDMPNHADSGIVVRAAKKRTTDPTRDRTAAERADAGERIIFVKHIPYVTGLNVIGIGKGDTSDQMDVTTSWHSDQLTVEFEIWSPDIQQAANKGDHRMTLTYFVVHSCTYPSQAGRDSPDTNLN